MAEKTYKVWIGLEEHSLETDEYVNVDLSFAETFVTTDKKTASKFAELLHSIGMEIVSNLEKTPNPKEA